MRKSVCRSGLLKCSSGLIQNGWTETLKNEEDPEESMSNTVVPALLGNDRPTSVSKSGAVLRRLKPPLTEKATSRWKSSSRLS